MFKQREVAIIADIGQASAILEPIRIRILEQLRAPGSASSVAREIGGSRQRIGYHVRLLEEHGLLRFVRERRRGNCIERVLMTAAKRFVISPETLGPMGAMRPAAEDRLSSSGLISVAAGIVADVGSLAEEAVRDKKRLPTLALETEVRFGSPSDQSAYAAELASFLGDLAQRYGMAQDTPGRGFRFVVCGHPVPGSTSPPVSPAPETPPA